MDDVNAADRKAETCEMFGLRFSMSVDGHDGERCVFAVRRIVDGATIASLVLGGQAAGRFDECVQAWIEDRVGAVPPAKVFCRACGAELVQVAGLDSDYQFDNALWVSFDGGYGMFIDPVGSVDAAATRVVICHDCAHQLCDQVSWIGELLDPAAGHSHRETELPALIAAGLRGWDIDQAARSDIGMPIAGPGAGADRAVLTS